MNLIQAEGLIRRQGMTIYQYGTHVLVDRLGSVLYALRSDRLDLGAYDGQFVRVSGSLVPGYPVDLGPEYLDVAAVQPLPPRGSLR